MTRDESLIEQMKCDGTPSALAVLHDYLLEVGESEEAVVTTLEEVREERRIKRLVAMVREAFDAPLNHESVKPIGGGFNQRIRNTVLSAVVSIEGSRRLVQLGGQRGSYVNRARRGGKVIDMTDELKWITYWNWRAKKVLDDIRLNIRQLKSRADELNRLLGVLAE